MKKKNRLCLFMVLCMLAVHCPAVHAEAQEEDKNQDVTLAIFLLKVQTLRWTICR